MNQIHCLISDLTRRVLEAYSALKFRPAQTFESIQAEYRTGLYLAMMDYLDSKRPITAFRNEYRRLTNDAFNAAAVAGWADGGASGIFPDHIRTWINGQIDLQITYIDGVFEKLRDLRKANPDGYVHSGFVNARADGYTYSLTGIYAYCKMQADKYKMGMWRVGPTEHCRTCAGLDGQVRTLAWFLEQGLIPQQSGSPTLECRGFNCQCGIYDVTTGRRLIP